MIGCSLYAHFNPVEAFTLYFALLAFPSLVVTKMTPFAAREP